MTTNQRHRLIRRRVVEAERGPGFWWSVTLSCGHVVDKFLPFGNVAKIETCHACSNEACLDEDEIDYGEE